MFYEKMVSTPYGYIINLIIPSGLGGSAARRLLCPLKTPVLPYHILPRVLAGWLKVSCRACRSTGCADAGPWRATSWHHDSILYLGYRRVTIPLASREGSPIRTLHSFPRRSHRRSLRPRHRLRHRLRIVAGVFGRGDLRKECFLFRPSISIRLPQCF